ncbi:MAG: ABC-three component system middle component 2 [Candidatus Bathyarchaeia archaeon]|jgi:DNA-binding PadR family transcriptional regulator
MVSDVPTVFSPEDDLIFNSSRLLVFFETFSNIKPLNGIDRERLCYYDFFASNPFIITRKQDPLWLKLEMTGLDPFKLEYQSASQRYSTKRESIKQYLALLVAKGLITVTNEDSRILYSITPMGKETAQKITTLYAITYRKSVRLILDILGKFTDSELWTHASKWFEAKTFLIDLYNLVDDADE